MNTHLGLTHNLSFTTPPTQSTYYIPHISFIKEEFAWAFIKDKERRKTGKWDEGEDGGEALLPACFVGACLKCEWVEPPR